MTHDVVLNSEALSTLLNEMGEGSSSRYWAVQRIKQYRVQASEADLFAVVEQHAWENGEDYTVHSWDFAKAVGADVYMELVQSFDLLLEPVVHDLYQLLHRGMTPEEIRTYDLFDGAGTGNLRAGDVLAFREAGVPGSYYNEVCEHTDWARSPSVSETLDYFRAGIPEDYVGTLLAAGATSAEVLSLWGSGVPAEYAVATFVDLPPQRR